MITNSEIKSMAGSLGITVTGVAAIERFTGAPAGFHPKDVYRSCHSVLVIAKPLPSEVIMAGNTVTYSNALNNLGHDVDQLAVELCLYLEKQGVRGIAVPTNDPYDYWDAERSRGMGILSLKHAAKAAGLGVMGRNTLLMNRKFGNRLLLGAVLINGEIEPDPMTDYQGCPDNCDICIDACPVGAIERETVNQELCRPISNGTTGRGFAVKTCWLCRANCPQCIGF